jgi:3'-5' exoribonuclease
MYEKKMLIKDLKKDDQVNDIFAVKFKRGVEQYKNGYKFELRVCDSSKEIMVKYWGPNNEEEVKKLYDSIKKDSVVLINGYVNEWNNQLEISASSIIPLKEGDYKADEFIRKTEKDIDEMWNELMGYVNSIKDEDYSKIVKYYFENEEFAKRFRFSPAAMYIHHGWIGGLLEHTLNVVKIADFYCSIHKELNRDLVITGALFHDIGKLEEFETTTNIHITREGTLLGHVSIAIEELGKSMDKLYIDKLKKIKLQHLILTHMGEYGSSKTPSLPEAFALFYADQADAQITHVLDMIKNANTDDDSIYDKNLGNIFIR